MEVSPAYYYTLNHTRTPEPFTIAWSLLPRRACPPSSTIAVRGCNLHRGVEGVDQCEDHYENEVGAQAGNEGVEGAQVVLSDAFPSPRTVVVQLEGRRGKEVGEGEGRKWED